LTLSTFCSIIYIELTGGKILTEVELLSFILQKGEVTSSEVAKKFGITIDHAYQVLRRLEKKGLLERNNRQYGAKFRLTERAKQISHRVKERNGNLGLLVFLGLAFLILLLASKEKDNSEEDDEKRKGSLF